MKTATLFLLLALPAAAPGAIAGENNVSPLFPRFSITGGGYAGQFATDVRVDAPGEPGTELSLERDLGLEDSATLQRFRVQWRPFDRHELAVSHFATERSGFENIDRDIEFRGTLYPVQAEVTTQFDAELWDVTYTYWLRKRERDGLGLMLGVSGISIEALINARAPNATVLITQSAETEVPVAVIGGQGRWALSDRVLFEVSAATLPNVELDVYSGAATMGAARLEYRVVPWLGIGAAYNYFRLDGSVEEADFTGELSMTVDGAEAYIRLAF